MVRPRDLVWSTLLIVLSSILISIFSHWAFNLCLDPMIISSVLATFKLNLLALSQQVRLLISEVTYSLRSATVFADKVILVSSANILGVASRRQLGGSLIYIEKSKGPRKLPSGTPQVTVLADERMAIYLWVRSLRYDWNHLIVTWSATKYDNCFRKIISWSIMSKAFLKVNEDYPVRKSVVDVNRPTICRLKQGR